MGTKEIKEYWDQRADENRGRVTGTTNDVYLRELEIKTFCDNLQGLGIKEGAKILDVGCGDGYTTLHIAERFPSAKITAVDFSESMIDNARINLKESHSSPTNITFQVADAVQIASFFEPSSFDYILSDRCLINLGESAIQYETIKQIYSLLKTGGYYLGIENFIEGQNALNEARKKMELNEIPIRWHNHFFREEEFLKNVQARFSDAKTINFSSAYYFATRVIYASICKLNNVEPDYLNEIHKVSINLPLFGNYSPIKLFILKK